MSYASPMLPFTGYTMTLYFVLTSPLRCEWNTNPCIYIGVSGHVTLSCNQWRNTAFHLYVVFMQFFKGLFVC
jgi:hypothetical protein